MDTGVASKTDWSIQWWFVVVYTAAVAIVASHAANKIKAWVRVHHQRRHRPHVHHHQRKYECWPLKNKAWKYVYGPGQRQCKVCVRIDET
eukprot:7687849-Lingulodinium_polyedra.AAC.1